MMVPGRLFSSVGELGSGVGKAGGGGGTIREAGGAFGKMEVAREEEYFHRMERQLIKEMSAALEKRLKSKAASGEITDEERITLSHLEKLGKVRSDRKKAIAKSKNKA